MTPKIIGTSPNAEANGMMHDHSDRYELSVQSEIIDREQDFEQSMSEHASPEGSNM